MKRCSISFIIKEMQIKTMKRYHLTPVRIAKIRNTGNNRCWQGSGEKRSLVHCWWECKLVQSLWKTVRRSLKKLKIELPYDPVIALMGYLPKKNPTKTLIWKGICTPMFIAALSTIAKLWKQPRYPSIDEWIKKIGIYTQYIGILFSYKEGKSCYLQQHGWS